jgi:hypothetical protein
MVTDREGYLELFDREGRWIKRPEYLTLALMVEPDPVSAKHLYYMMLTEDEMNPSKTQDQSELSPFAAEQLSRKFAKTGRTRALAGQVVLEAVRLSQATSRPPTLGASIRLVAYKENLRKHRSSMQDSTLRTVERAFSDYRATAHLNGAAALMPELVSKMTDDEVAFRRFLGTAKGLSEFIARNVEAKAFRWAPHRIPSQIVAVHEVSFAPLTEQELAAAGVT